MTARASAIAPRIAGGAAAIATTVVVVATALLGGLATAISGSPIGLAASAALALGSVLLIRPHLGSILFLALLWLNVPAVLVQVHGIPSVAVQASVVLLRVPVARYLLRREPVIVTPAIVAVLGFVAANLVSAATSANPTLATEGVLTVVAEGLLVYLLVSNAVRTPHMARLAVITLVLASLAMAGLALFQEATETYGDNYFGFAQNTLNDDDTAGTDASDTRPRMAGPVGEKNRFAQVLIVVLPLALFGMQIRHPFWGRVVPIGSSLVILAGVFLTFSRGGAVALAILAAVLVLRKYVRLAHMLTIGVAFALTVLIVAPEFIARVESIGSVAGWVSGEGEDPDGAVIGRTTSNIAALLVFVDHPVAGVGPGVYAEDYSIQYANRLGLRFFVEERRAHNMYIEWAAELGLLGLVAGVAMIAITLIQLAALRAYWLPRRRDLADLAGAFSLALIAYAATAVFLHLSYMRYFFTLLALANAVIWMLAQERQREAVAEAASGPTAIGQAALPEGRSQPATGG